MKLPWMILIVAFFVITGNLVSGSEASLDLTLTRPITDRIPGELSVRNTGNINLTDVTLSSQGFPVSFSLNHFDLPLPTTGGGEVTLNATRVGGNLLFGYTPISITAQSAEGAYSTLSTNITRSFCANGPRGNNITMDGVEIDNEGGDANFWRPGDSLKVRLDVENIGETDFERVFVEFALFNASGRERAYKLDFIFPDQDTTINLGPMAEGESATAEFEFDIPDDFPPGTYRMAIKAYEDGDQSRICQDSFDGFDHLIYEQIEIIDPNRRVSESVDSCKALVSSGTYRLIRDLTGADSCIMIIAHDVYLDLNGKGIKGENRGIGIDVRGARSAKIVNGEVSNFSIGINIGQYAHKTILEKLYIHHNSQDGLQSNNNGGARLKGNTFFSNGYSGLSLNRVSDYQFISNKLKDNDYGVYCTSCYKNIIQDNQISSGQFGIVIAGNSSSNSVLGNEVFLNSEGIVVTSGPVNNLIQKNKVYSNMITGIGLYHDARFNSVIGNNLYSNTQNGIYVIYGSNDNKFTGNTITNSSRALAMKESSGNKFSENKFFGNMYSFNFLSDSVSGNLAYNNFFNDSNIFYSGITRSNSWNVPLRSGRNIVGGSFVGGNYWANPSGTGFSETCADEDGNRLCDTPYHIGENNIDYLPLTS